MQAEIQAEQTGTEVRISGINQIGAESGNASISNGRTIPWLQDTSEEGVWASWNVTYRDVVVLDSENRVAAVYNLTEHNLALTAEYDSLRTILLDLAGK